MTSNATNGKFGDKNVGFLKGSGEIFESERLSEFFSPEFVNRIDGIIRFSALTQDSILLIVEKRLTALAERLKEMGVSLTYDKEVCEVVARKSKATGRGARAALRAVTVEVENPISSLMITESPKHVTVYVSDGIIEVCSSDINEDKRGIITDEISAK